MKVKRLILLSLGILGSATLAVSNASAADPVFPQTSQEQLQQDRMDQWERNRRLEANQERPFENIAVPIDVPSDENGTSFHVFKIQLD